jgi:hypothetical protein
LHAKLQGKNKITGITASFKEKLKLWKTQLTKGVLNHFPSIQNALMVYAMLLSTKLLQKPERIFQDSEVVKFTLSFITSSFKKMDM